LWHAQAGAIIEYHMFDKKNIIVRTAYLVLIAILFFSAFVNHTIAEEDKKSLIDLMDKVQLGISQKEVEMEFTKTQPKPSKLTDNIYGRIDKEGQTVILSLFVICSEKLATVQALFYSKDKSLIDESFKDMKTEL
jgi:hypothetical protein